MAYVALQAKYGIFSKETLTREAGKALPEETTERERAGVGGWNRYKGKQ